MISVVFFVALAAARPAAVVPASGVSTSVTEMQDLLAIDDAVRGAVLLKDGLTLQTREQTVAALKSARAAGVTCTVADVACWQKVAVLSDVELLVVPMITPRADGSFAVVLTLTDGTRVDRASDALPRGKELDARAKRLVDEVFARAAAPQEPPSSPPTSSPSTPAPSTPTTADAPVDAPLAPWIVGAGVAGIGVVVGAAAGGLVAWAVLSAPPAPVQVPR